MDKMEPVRLSPSRINDYQQCPALYNYRVIQKLPEPLSLDAIRGTLVHKVLEELLSKPIGDRNPDVAKKSVSVYWLDLKNEYPELAFLVTDENEWFNRVFALLDNYFLLENPQSFEPTHMEAHLSLEPNDNLQLHGYVDRIDIAPTGEVRIVDYKTGKSPKPGYEDKVLFQLRFYALLWYRINQNLPKLLQVHFLGDQRSIKSSPSLSDLEMTEKKSLQVGKEILISIEKDYWPTQTSRLCDWCSFKKICPAFSN